MRPSSPEDTSGLSYALEVLDSAKHLVCFFPSIGVGPKEPRVDHMKRVDGLNAHRLVFARDANLFFFPGVDSAIPLAAIDIVLDVADGLGVPPENISCVGHSFQAICALLTGLRAEVGRLILAAPTLRMTYWAKKLVAAVPDEGFDDQRIANAFRVIGDPVALAQDMDRVVHDAMSSRTSPFDIDLFVSQRDDFYEDSVVFEQRVQNRRNIRCDVHVAEYIGHDRVIDQYEAFLCGVLDPLLGPRQGSSLISYHWKPLRLNA